MNEVVVGWWEDEDGNETPVLGEMPPILDPFPFTKQGRQLQASEHELRLSEAVNKVAALVAKRAEVQHDLRALRGKRA